MYNIPHPQYSKVSNAKVFEVAGVAKLSATLHERQLLLFGEIARKTAGDPIRAAVFEDGSTALRKLSGVRRRGRPRQKWAEVVHGLRACACGWGRSGESSQNIDGQSHVEVSSGVLLKKQVWDGRWRRGMRIKRLTPKRY